MKLSVPRSILHQYAAGISACLCVFTTGSMFAWMTPLLDQFLSPGSEIPMSEAESSWIVSIIEVGNFISSLPAAYLANKVGRKSVLLATGPLYILTWFFILWKRTAFALLVTRCCQGIIMGVVFTISPVYLGEIASDATRGAITSIFFSSYWIGFIISVAVGPVLDFVTFTYFTIALNIPFIVTFLWFPDSPYYYLLAGDTARARDSLKWFRDLPPDMLKDELNTIKESVDADLKRSTGVRDLVATAPARRSFILLMIISAVRVSSGTGGILVYSTIIFDNTPNLPLSADTLTFSFSLFLFLGGLIGAFTSDRFGRRPLLLVSCVGCFISIFITATYYFLLTNTSIDVSRYSWISPFSILLYALVCSSGLYSVCVSYTSELFPSHTRSLASSFGATSVTVFSFISIYTFQPITDWLGLYANFYLYALPTFFGIFYFYFAAPETKQKSFVQIRNELYGIELAG